ncbi:hypothetical protein [Deinococcus actinosclerus]|uniref:hypothetical protein n=1 Tax=Deinococcus actinosclerus TaxID=1768108 RepID=UPI000A8DDEDD|nr:hypothetical protein [Deinococcus actinosclerus]
MPRPSALPVPAQPPARVDVTLHLNVLGDEAFTSADVTEWWLHHILCLAGAAPHEQFLRLGGSRHLRLSMQVAPGAGDRPAPLLHVRADLSEGRPVAVTATRHLRLAPGQRQTLDLHLPADPQPYARLTVTSGLMTGSPAPPAALRAQAVTLGWAPPDAPPTARVIAGGYELRTPSGTLYHDGQRVCALHAAADRAYRSRGGPAGPLGLPAGSALIPERWHVPFRAHDLLHRPGGTALLPRHVWAAWSSARARLGAPTGDTAPLAARGLTLTPCQRGTLVTDEETRARVPTRTVHVRAARLARALGRHLRAQLPPGGQVRVCPPAPGSPLRYAVVFTGPAGPPVTLEVPLVLRLTPAPDTRRPVRLSARQAGVIDLPTGLPAAQARTILRVLEAALGRPATLLRLPEGSGLVGARVTLDGALHLDVLHRQAAGACGRQSTGLSADPDVT